MPAPPDLLDTIKDDLGIPPGDTTSDAWLQRRIDGIWARFEVYTGRPLGLVSPWLDDWGTLIVNHPAVTEPPILRAQPGASVFLRVFPVARITSITMNNSTTVDPADVLFDQATGKLVGLYGGATDLRNELVGARALVAYEAGFAAMPADLYEALLGVLGPLWAARQAQASGLPGMATRISTTDVGEVEWSNSGNVFVEATLKGVRITDPILGPWGVVLDPYVDWRSMIGGAYPTTVAEVAP